MHVFIHMCRKGHVCVLILEGLILIAESQAEDNTSQNHGMIQSLKLEKTSNII